jgi:hypothetical protein
MQSVKIPCAFARLGQPMEICMKLITFEHAARMSYGAVKGERVVDLGSRPAGMLRA